MSEKRNVAHKLTFSGAGQQSIAIAADEHVNVFQVDVSVDVDTNIAILVGSTEIFSGNIKATALPIQLFFYAFGKGRGTGVKGDDLTIQLGAAGVVFIDYIIHRGV